MYFGIDLGSTNIKAALYNSSFALVDRQSFPVEYIRENSHVEFNAEKYAEDVVALLSRIMKENNVDCIKELAFTGQAETLVVLGKDGKPLMNAISWMDDRSGQECEELSSSFPADKVERITGQMALFPTWPATKILWLKKHRRDVFDKAATYMLLKDYVVYYLTGKKVSDMSIATFSLYFDIYEKCYWKEMLKAIDVNESQLPPLCEPCTVAGVLKEDVASRMGTRCLAKVNVGTLDHFAGMIGTGNLETGNMTLSTGTVMALATKASDKTGRNTGIAMHYGFIPNTHIMLPVAESGGVSLQWFGQNVMGNTDFAAMDREAEKRGDNNLLFLPYIVGTNAPDFNPKASGVFWGLRAEHNGYDMARAVMEGVAFLLRMNCDNIREKGTNLVAITATGGGSKSALWCQMQANATGLPVRIPKEKEAACLGAAIIAATEDGVFASFEEAAARCVEFTKVYEPVKSEKTEEKYRRFLALYKASVNI